MRPCPHCGKDNEQVARFCSQCGTPLTALEPARKVRKTVTMLFCDVVGAGRARKLLEHLQPAPT
jgi:predicted amidophosphoribosyltransferase